jgi:arylsulfatase A-like enzyme
MRRRPIVILALAGLALGIALCLARAARTPAGRAPSTGTAPVGAPDAAESAAHGVVLVTLDTTRADRFSSAPDSPLAKTRIWLARGTRFTEAVTPAPVTGPAHASIMTGLDPVGHGALSNSTPLPPTAVTLAERLTPRFQTAAFVSSSVLRRARGLEQGFAFYDDEVATPYTPRALERAAAATTDRALAWLAAHDDAPFFVWLHYFDAHAPYRPPPALLPKGYDDLLADPERAPTIEQLDAIFDRRVALDARTVAFYQALYDGELRAIDGELARLARYFEERPYADRLLLALTADHGEELYEHDAFFQHNRSLYDGVMRVPLVLMGPGVPTATVTRQVSTASLFATLLTLVGETPPPGVAPSLFADTVGEPQIIMKEPHPAIAPWGVGVRAPPWKLLSFEGAPPRLFDLAADPRERYDVSAAHPEVAARLQGLSRARVIEPLRALVARGGVGADVDPETRAMLEALGYTQ